MTRLTWAELLKLRKRRGVLWFSVILLVGVINAIFTIAESLHLSNPARYGPVGGLNGLQNATMGMLAVGAIATTLVGATAGTADVSSGVFRELVATGRSRWALYWARVPGVLLLVLPLAVIGYAGAMGFVLGAGGSPSVSLALAARSLGWVLLSLGGLSLVALGFASLVGNRGMVIGVLIGWYFIFEPILARLAVLGGSRDGLLSVAFDRLIPFPTGPGPVRAGLTLTVAGAGLVVVAWLAVWLGIGGWRTVRRDA